MKADEIDERGADLIDSLAASICDDEDAVECYVELVPDERSKDGFCRAVVLHVAREDKGKVIGKLGANAEAMRTLLYAYAGRVRRMFRLEIAED